MVKMANFVLYFTTIFFYKAKWKEGREGDAGEGKGKGRGREEERKKKDGMKVGRKERRKEWSKSADVKPQGQWNRNLCSRTRLKPNFP